MMRYTLLHLTAVLLASTAFDAPGRAAPKEKPITDPRVRSKRSLRRADCFFGLHLDLHPSREDKALGADVSEENVRALLDRVKPDYVQYDCKGCPGYLGYPSKVGKSAPGIVKDSLAVWSEATHEKGVGLFIHYCGLWDSLAVEEHPDWAVVDASGNKHPYLMSVFSPYADEVLIPQIAEAAGAYGLSGAWVDADSWCASIDYSPAALVAWKKETGQQDAPKDRSDPRWPDWKNFHRRHYEQYLNHWVDALHARHPELQLCSNWMYTTYSPKPVAAKVDFLSGDYTLTVSVDRARTDARYLAHAGLPWDLMAWGFNNGKDLGFSLKPAVHLQQEASAVLMQGGGFQIYYVPTRTGYVTPDIIDTAGQVADFCRARESVSHKSATVPQVALLLSSETQADRSDGVFAPWGTFDELEGALHALLESHYSVDIMAEHQLQPRLKEFPLVALPDVYKLTESFRQALLEYVRDGGSLLLLGARCARLFPEAVGAEFAGEPAEASAELVSPAGIVNVNGLWQAVKAASARPLGYRHPTRDARKDGEIASTIAAYGKGRVGAIYGPVALAYFRSHHPALRSFIGEAVSHLFPNPAVRIDGPSCVDIALRRTRKGHLSLHLLNLAETQRADRFLSSDHIPPVGPIRIEMQCPEKPKRVRQVPQARSLKWTWENGTLKVTVPRLEIYDIVVVE
ncbi:MAG: hypothetical protein IT210_15285 [Armatimonadetes bacterium]|nr:hypothetical protein [Armatimonadota bacterium]